MPWLDNVISNNIIPDVDLNQSPDIEWWNKSLFIINTILGSYEASPDMPLQLLLFFNVFLFPFWFLTSGIFLSIKCLGNLTKFLSVAVFLMSSVIECIRLYLGYIGNLSEQIPELAGFWMLSILLQLPLLTFLLTNPYLEPRPIELTLNGVMWVLLTLQLLAGFIALRAASSRAKEYYALKSKVKTQISSEEVKLKKKKNE